MGHYDSCYEFDAKRDEEKKMALAYDQRYDNLLREFSTEHKHGHQTRAGLKVKILHTTAVGNLPIVALVTLKDGTEVPMQFAANGFSNVHDSYSLVNIAGPPRVKSVWLGFYDTNAVVVFETAESLRSSMNMVRVAGDKRPKIIGSLKVELKEGQFRADF